jgi:predicted nucleic acid-binding protein
MERVKIFFDANVLIAGSVSQTGASFLLLQLCELGLLKGYTSCQVIEECHRNLLKILPEAITAFDKIVELYLEVVNDLPEIQIIKYTDMAHYKDLPILASAINLNTAYLTTFNLKHFTPNPELGLVVVQPGELISKIRQLLNQLAD